jgi:hypothetical protein
MDGERTLPHSRGGVALDASVPLCAMARTVKLRIMAHATAVQADLIAPRAGLRKDPP